MNKVFVVSLRYHLLKLLLWSELISMTALLLSAVLCTRRKTSIAPIIYIYLLKLMINSEYTKKKNIIAIYLTNLTEMLYDRIHRI